MRVRVLQGPPSCGKTHQLLTEITSNAGLYILASPRVELIEERERDLRAMLASSGQHAAVEVIHGENGRRAPVVTQIHEAVEEHRGDRHAVLLVTHEGLMSADVSNATGYHVMIDEMPLAVYMDEISVEAASVYFEQGYDLERLGPKLSRLHVREGASDLRSLLRDDMLRKAVLLHKKARSRQGVYVDVEEWQDARLRGRMLTWWSAWTPLELASCASVTFAAAGYDHSILAHVTEALYPGCVQIERVHLAGRPRQPRRIVIHYFAESHRGSSSFWEGEGRHCLTKVCRYLESVKIGYWSGNKVVADYFHGRVPGEQVRPKAEGTNSLMHHTSCAFIYSAKTLPSEATLIKVFGLNREKIERAREIEDVIQFTTRGNTRDPDATGDYNVFLYDLYQAERLGHYFEEHGFGTVELVPVAEAGLLDFRRPQRGRPAKRLQTARTYEEHEAEKREKDAERQRQKREREREKMVIAGTYRPRGRPRRTASPSS